jgi:hypothetical protein
LAAVALLLPSCTSDGHIDILGYTSRPNYDLSIHTVHVPIFKNVTYRRGLEFDLTRALVREIEARTPYKVVSDPACADTELTGTITNFTKMVLNVTPFNEIREAQTVLTVQVAWRDLRPGHYGEVLSQPKPPPTAVVPPPPPKGTPLPLPPPTIVQSEAGFVPELGQSLATAKQRNVDKVARQIVFMMEKPW